MPRDVEVIGGDLAQACAHRFQATALVDRE